MTLPLPGRAVEPGFTLPWNREWTMADHWSITERQCRSISYRTERIQRKQSKVKSAGTPGVWTDDLVGKLRALWFTDASCSQIAKFLGHGFTKNAIAGKVRRLDLPMRKHQAPRKVA